MNYFTTVSLILIACWSLACQRIHQKIKSNPENEEKGMTSFENIEKRKFRRFALYKNGILALILTDSPGVLISTAGPSPEGYPTHPFLSGEARYTLFEDEIRSVLEVSRDFDDFLDRLLQKNYDAVAIDQAPAPDGIETAYRVYRSGKLKGFAVKSKGQSATLRRQPVEGQFVFNFAILTIYDESAGNLLVKSLPDAHSFDELIDEIKNLGYQLQAIPSD